MIRANIEFGVNKSALFMPVLLIFLVFFTNAQAAFYQATTMANYCRQYIKMISLESSYNQLEAGICSGYIASKIEVMDLSGQLCQRETVNLDDVVKAFIKHVETSENAEERTATYSVVELLEKKYSCDNEA